MFDARNKQFDTVMAALGSNSERWGIFTISLEFARQASGTSEGGRHNPPALVIFTSYNATNACQPAHLTRIQDPKAAVTECE